MTVGIRPDEDLCRTQAIKNVKNRRGEVYYVIISDLHVSISRDLGSLGIREETGTVNTWNVERQFGFVSCNSGRGGLGQLRCGR